MSIAGCLWAGVAKGFPRLSRTMQVRDGQVSHVAVGSRSFGVVLVGQAADPSAA